MRSRISPLRRGLSLFLISTLLMSGFSIARAQDSEPPPPPSGEEEGPPPAEESAPEELAPPDEMEEAGEPSPLPPPGATLQGKILREDRKTPWAAAVFYAIASDETVFSAAPSDDRGRYRLQGLPPGTYRLAVATDEGVFSLENPLGITSASEFTINLATVPAEAATAVIPGVSLLPRGFAYILQGKRGSGTTFWRTRQGIIVLVLAGITTGLIISTANDDSKDDPISRSTP